MQITVKLYAMLTDYLPSGAVRNVGAVDIATDATVDAVIEQLRLPKDLVHLVLLNGVYVAPERRHDTLLQDADTLAIWPPVAGG